MKMMLAAVFVSARSKTSERKKAIARERRLFHCQLQAEYEEGRVVLRGRADAEAV
jgi:hypothetical protein